MAMTLEEALEKLADAKARIKVLEPLETEVQTLRGHKGELEADLAKARSAKNDAEAKAADLEAKIPKDGSRVLPKEQAKDYDAFVALNLKPDEIKTKLEAGSEAQQKAHRADTREALRKLGYEPTDRLVREFDGVDLTATIGEDKKPVGKVKAGEDEHTFSDWAKAQGLDSDLERYRSQPGGVEVLPQVTAGSGGVVTGTSKHVDELNQARESRPNPLLKGTSDGDKNKVLS